MIADLVPYPGMKDSGVPWLREVPETWEMRRLKTIFAEVDRRSGTGREPLLSLRMQTGLVDHHATGGKPVPPEDLVHYKVTVPGEIVMNRMRAAAGLFAATPMVGLVSPDYAVLRPRAQVELEYFVRLFRTPQMMSAFRLESRGLGTGESGFLRLYTERFGMVCVPAPPAKEQVAIVRFLDHADQRIRRHIRAKQKLIELLEEQKQAIIHHAVTRSLDPNVRLKDSGVEWLGEVPEHWEVVPLCAVGRPRKVTDRGDRELLSVYLGRGVVPFSAVEERRANPTSDDLSKYQAVEPGDLVLNNQQAWRGSVGVSRYEGIVSPAYLVLALDGRLQPAFADRLFSDKGMVAQYLVCSKGVGSIQRNLYWPYLRRVATLVPPMHEQSAIVRFLDAATASLAAAVDQARREITLLREYRTRLIADVVTGKLDVREAAARLPEEVAEAERVDDEETVEAVEGEGGLDDADAAEEVTDQ